MSAILDALKKAQSERKKSQRSGGPFQKGMNPSILRNKSLIVVGFAAVFCVAAAFVLAPHLVGVQARKQAPLVNKPVIVASAQAPLVSQPPSGTVQAGPGKASDIAPPVPVVQREADKAPEAGKTPDGSAVKGKNKGEGSKVSIPKSKPQMSASEEARDTSGRVALEKYSESRIAGLYNSGVRAGVQGDFKEARRLYLAVIAEKPGYYEALNNLGVISLREGKIKEALFYFRKCIEYKGDYAKAFNNMGLALVQEGQNREAEECFRKAIGLESETVEPYVNLSGLLRSQKRQEEASKLLRVLIDRKVRNSGLFLSYGLLRDELGDREEAARYYRYYLNEGGDRESRAKVIERLKVLEENKPAENP